jgi:hypothetical protein
MLLKTMFLIYFDVVVFELITKKEDFTVQDNEDVSHKVEYM